MFTGHYRYSDPHNYGKKRNVRNSDRYNYNCAGYALSCFSWYCPFSFHEDNVSECAKQILEDFPNTRIVSSKKDLLPNEYLIAFRTSKTDFHFMRRGKNGVWYQKRGQSPYLIPVKEADVFNKIWPSNLSDGGYTSEMVLFAVKE